MSLKHTFYYVVVCDILQETYINEPVDIPISIHGSIECGFCWEKQNKTKDKRKTQQRKNKQNTGPVFKSRETSGVHLVISAIDYMRCLEAV